MKSKVFLFFLLFCFSLSLLFPKSIIAQDLSSSVTDKFYTGQIKDDTGLYYYNARYYDPQLGIFTSADRAQGPNRYAYVGGNPIMRNDPSGTVEMEFGDGQMPAYIRMLRDWRINESSRGVNFQNVGNALVMVTDGRDSAGQGSISIIGPTTYQEKVKEGLIILEGMGYLDELLLSGRGPIVEPDHYRNILKWLYEELGGEGIKGSLGYTLSSPEIFVREEAYFGGVDSMLGLGKSYKRGEIGPLTTALAIYHENRHSTNLLDLLAKGREEAGAYAGTVEFMKKAGAPEFLIDYWTISEQVSQVMGHGPSIVANSDRYYQQRKAAINEMFISEGKQSSLNKLQAIGWQWWVY